jgi:hypothetical protein
MTVVHGFKQADYVARIHVCSFLQQNVHSQKQKLAILYMPMAGQVVQLLP